MERTIDESVDFMKPHTFKILAYEPSPLGMLCLRRRELLNDPGKVIFEITLNDEFLMSSYNTDSECALSRMAIKLHGGGKKLKVLVGGLGLGYTAYTALQSEKVSSVKVIEFLPQVIDWMKSGLVPLSETLNNNKRLKIEQNDLYQMLLKPAHETFDLILIDIDHSPNELLNLKNANEVFYTEEGLLRAKEHLAPGGILGVWSYAENSPFAAALFSVFEEVCVEGVKFRNKLMDEIHTDWLFFGR